MPTKTKSKSKLADLKPKVPVDPPNIDMFIGEAKANGESVHTLKPATHQIRTYGNVDSRRTPTRNKNVKIKESIYDFIDQHTDGTQNVTLILNHLLEIGIQQISTSLEAMDVDIKGS